MRLKDKSDYEVEKAISGTQKLMVLTLFLLQGIFFSTGIIIPLQGTYKNCFLCQICVVHFQLGFVTSVNN